MAEDSLNMRHAMSFQSGVATSSLSEMVVPYASTAAMMSMNMNMDMDMDRSMMFHGNSSLMRNSSLSPAPGFIQAPAESSTSSTSFLRDSVSIPGLKHDAGLAVEWSVEEQYKLKQGLLNYKDEPNIMKYIKIAATLRDKTVRDVAMRCRWISRKRRKVEEHYLGKKVNNRKDKLVEFNSKKNIPSVLQQSNVIYPITIPQLDQTAPVSFDVLGINGTARHLLEQNALAFSQIAANLSTYKLQDNIDLFCRTRSNITAILDDMAHTSGIMSQMPPLPVSINEDLANNILPHTTESIMLSLPIGIHLKPEPEC